MHRGISAPAGAGRVRAAALAFCAALLVALGPQALAGDIGDIGFVDQGAIGQLKPFRDAQQQFAQYQQHLRAQFQAAVKGKSQADQQKIFEDFNKRSAQKQQELFGPLFARAQTAIAAVGANKNLSVIVDKQIVIYGGMDVTKDVIDLLDQPGPVVPPVGSPPQSEVGYVDQQQIDSLPKVKKANDDFLKIRKQLQDQLNQQLIGKTQDQQQKIFADFNNQLADQQKKLLQPIVDATQKAVSEVAKSKNLVLVIDATNRVYGGTDITNDVVKALQ